MMQDFEAYHFAVIMAGMAELYDKKISKSLNHVYWHLLAAYGLDEVKAALQAYLCNPDGGQYFPKPADLIRHSIAALLRFSPVKEQDDA